MTKRLLPLVFLIALLLTACNPQAVAPTVVAAPTVATVAAPTAAATAEPVVEPAATTTAAPATAAPAAPTAAPATQEAGALPAGWQVETNEQLSIAIPPGWRALNLTGPDAQSVFDGVKQADPKLAGIIGGPEALMGAAFWAFGPEQSEFVDNLNIRRSPLGSQRVTDLQQVIDVLLPEYDKMGLKVTSTEATLRVHEFPAARVTYTLTMNVGDGKTQEVRGRQIIVATDSDLWVLSFSTTPEREAAMAPLFEQSAQTFEPK